MNITIGIDEKLRIETYENRVFIDAYRGKDGICIETVFYPIHFQQLRKKEREMCMFSFYDLKHIEDYDFGWYSDAEIVWQSF